MKPFQWPNGFIIEQLDKRHKRSAVFSGLDLVDEWLKKGSTSPEKKTCHYQGHSE